MLFNSFEFVALVAITAFIYYLPWFRRAQVGVLIASSLAFYAYGQPALLILLLASILVNAVTSFQVLQATTVTTRRSWASTGVGLNLAILGLFKYGGLIGQSLGWAGAEPDSPAAWLLTLPLPIGISFYTFQGISLVVDVWHLPTGDRWDGQNASSRRWWPHLVRTMFFVSFFPQLVAGPIVKAHEFFPQIGPKRWRDIPWDRVVETLILGYFLKMVIADNLRDQTFWMTFPYFEIHSSYTLLVLLFGYSMQIFADFAGYSLIAIGVGFLLGYRLPENFNFPYRAQSIAEFWHRWHISLSSWLREYLYFPLGGNRRGRRRTYFNLLIVMGLGGLWHGAAWSYLVWGLYHGIGLCAERFASRFKSSDESRWWTATLKTAAVFSFVSAGWLLFRLNDFSEVLSYIQACSHNFAEPIDTGIISFVILFALPVVLWHAIDLAKTRTAWRPSPRLRSVGLGICLFAILTNPGTPKAFIYFQF